MDRPQAGDPSADVPSAEQLARVLLRAGARNEATQVLRIAVERDPKDRAAAALLRAVQARPDADVYGPDVPLDLPLAHAYLRAGCLIEARAVLRAAGMITAPPERPLLPLLEEILAPPPGGSGEMAESAQALSRALRMGEGAAALSMMPRATSLPPWLAHRGRLLAELMDPAGHVPAPRLSLVAELAHKLSHGDIAGALAAAR